MHRRFIELSCVGAGALVLALLLTYPLVLGLDRLQRMDSGDCQLGVWNVAWVAHALTTDPLNLYNTNIFHPSKNTLAFSEANIAAGVIATPVYWLTGRPLLAYNFAFLIGGFTAAAVSAYALARYLTGNRAAAAFAGVAYAFCPYIFARLAHIQLQLTFGIPLSLLALHYLVDTFDRPRDQVADRTLIGRSLQLGLILAVQALSCAYYGIFAGMAVGLAVLFYTVSRRLWRRSGWWLSVIVAASFSIALVLPFFKPYQKVQEAGFSRTLEETRPYSADGRSWLVSGAYAHRWLHPYVKLDRPGFPRWKEVLFPGFVPIGLLVLGVWVGSRSRAGGEAAEAGGSQRRVRETTILYLLVLVFAFWFSFGPDGGLYSLFFHTIPIFSLLRAPARMAIVVQLALVMLGAIGIARLSAAWTRRRRALLGGALVAVLAVEFNQAPVLFTDAPQLETAYEVLKALPPAPIVAYPFFEPRIDYHKHTYYMLQSMYHWRPMVNGYSDHIPPGFRAMVETVKYFPSRDSFLLLKRRGVRYVIFHLRHYDRPHLRRVMENIATYSQYLTPRHISDDSWLYEITSWPD